MSSTNSMTRNPMLLPVGPGGLTRTNSGLLRTPSGKAGCRCLLCGHQCWIGATSACGVHLVSCQLELFAPMAMPGPCFLDQAAACNLPGATSARACVQAACTQQSEQVC